jgi:hypothetical protein
MNNESAGWFHKTDYGDLDEGDADYLPVLNVMLRAPDLGLLVKLASLFLNSLPSTNLA